MTTNSINAQTIRYPTDYTLESLHLITNVETEDNIPLTTFLVELNLFEDIFSPTISGQLVISDGFGIIPKFRLNGTEFLRIVLKKNQKDKDNETYTRTFRVNKIGKINNPSMITELTTKKERNLLIINTII